MTKKLLIALGGIGLVLLAGSGIAQADDDVRFGIRPTEATEDRPETFSYFSYELAPDAVVSDAALVMNIGDAPVTLKVYAADGITAVNGGTAFAREGQEPTGVSRWLSLSVTEIALEPGEEMVVPFTMTVPSDASPGHHVAGLVVAAPPIGDAPPSGEGQEQFATLVVQQAAVAVVVDVPGPRVAGLEITGTCLKEQNDLGATFVIAVQSTGNVFVKGEGSHVISGRNGKELASIPLKMDTVLPGDATTFEVSHPIHLADGGYLVSAVLEYEGKTAFLEGVGLKVKDGQPEVGCEPEEEEAGALPPADTTEIIPAPGEDAGPPIGRYAAYGAPLVALALLAAVIVRRRRNRRQARRDLRANIAALEGVETSAKDDQPEVGCEPEPSLRPLVPKMAPAPAEEGGPPIGLYAAFGSALLALGLAALVLILPRRAKRAEPGHRP